MGAISIAIVRPVSAGETQWRYYVIMPPAKYDVPYLGKLTIWITQRPIKEWCPTTNSTTAACADTSLRWPGWPPNECSIWILKPIVDLKPVTLVYDGEPVTRLANLVITLRHEIAHCNGWGLGPNGWLGHPDGRKVYEDDASIEMPTLPPSTRWLDADNLSCITPDRAVEDCKRR
jgi:hypothetical protein